MSSKFDKYNSISDEELVGLIREGETEIVDYLLDKYKNLVRGKAKTMFLIGGDTEDLVQEGMIGVFQAIREYDFGRDASFRTFAELCACRKMYSAIRTSNEKKHIPLNNYVSFENGGRGDDGENSFDGSFVDVLPAFESDPVDQVMAQELGNYLEEEIPKQLTDLEQEVLELYSTGLNTNQISAILEKSAKSTDNALQRAKSKIRAIIKNWNEGK